MNIDFDFPSLYKICGQSKEVVIYGFEHCKYKELARAIADDNQLQTNIGHVYDYSIGWGANSRLTRKIDLKTSDLPQDQDNMRRMSARCCKTGLTLIVLENHRRLKEAQAKKEKPTYIPVIFCLDIVDSTTLFRIPDSSSITTKFPLENDLYTNKELRRIYKLTTEFSNSRDPNLKEFGQVAKETFKFVRLYSDDNTHYVLEPMKALWEENQWEWKAAWDQRRMHWKAKPQGNGPEDWRPQIIKWIKN